MSVTDGPTVQEVDRLNAINTGGGIGLPGDPNIRDALARAMVAQGGPQHTNFGGAGFDFTDPRYTSRLAAGANSAGPDMSAMLAARQRSMPSAPNDYASLMASRMFPKAQPAAGGGGASDYWNMIAEALHQRDVDPSLQYFGSRGPMSGSVTDIGWMDALQPWQGGVSSGDIPGSGVNRSGFTGGGSAARADPAYWGWQGPLQGYAAGSMGDLSGFNSGRGGGAGGTGGLTPQDFAIFSRLVSPQALQDWLNAGGVQGQFGGSMGGEAGGGGGGSGGGGGGGGSGGSSSGGQGPGSSGQGPGSSGQGPAGYSNAGYNPGDVSRGPDLGNTLSNSAFDSGLNQSAVSTIGAFGPNGFGPVGTTGNTYSGQPGFSPGIGMSLGTPGQGTPDGWGYGAQEGDTFGGAW